MQLTSHSVEETIALGALLGRLAPDDRRQPTCIALDGQLGAGKTHLARGIAQGASVNDLSLVCSPTYVLMNIYEGNKPVYHIDAYRVQSPEDLAAAGIEEILRGDGDRPGGIVVIEWASRIEALLPPDRLHITIEHAGDMDSEERLIEMKATGPRSAALLDAIIQHKK